MARPRAISAPWPGDARICAIPGHATGTGQVPQEEAPAQSLAPVAAFLAE
jgi:hypothetical protein